MTTNVPNVPEYTGDVPLIGQGETEFSQNAQDSLQYQAALPVNLNSSISAMNTLGGEVEDLAASAELSNSQAAAVANFKGDWSGLTGALSTPASVRHNGLIWLLLNNLADVTASEPSVTADWEMLGNTASLKFDTIADLEAANLPVGAFAHVKWVNEAGKVGGGLFEIVTYAEAISRGITTGYTITNNIFDGEGFLINNGNVAVVNDNLFGFQNALLAEAGILPNGVPDKSTSSKCLEAARRVVGNVTNFSFATVADMVSSTLTGGKVVDLVIGDSAFVRGNTSAGDGGRTEYLVVSPAGLTPDGEKVIELDSGLMAVEQPPIQTNFDVMDFNYDEVMRRSSDYDTSSAVVWGLAHTGQSLAEGGVGGDAVSGISPPIYPDYALMLSDHPVGRGTETLSNVPVTLAEDSRVTIASSYTRGVIADQGADGGFQAVFHGQAYGGQNYDALKKGGTTGTYEKVLAQVTSVHTAKSNVIYKAVSCIHGEQDGLDNNTSYAADLLEWQTDFDTDIKAVTGQADDVRLLLCQTATAGGYGYNGGITEITFPTPIQQLAAHVANTNISLVCPKYFVNYYDHSHITNNAQRVIGEYYAKALLAGTSWEPLRPSTVTGVGNTVVIDFVGNVGSLAFDTTLVTAATNQGFSYVDDSANTITGVSITGAAQVTITLSGTVGANAFVAYAYHNGAGGAANQVAGLGDRGNLRDSDTALSKYDGANLYNWCVMFREAVA